MDLLDYYKKSNIFYHWSSEKRKEETKAEQTKNSIKPKKSSPRHITLLNTCENWKRKILKATSKKTKSYLKEKKNSTDDRFLIRNHEGPEWSGTFTKCWKKKLST